MPRPSHVRDREAARAGDVAVKEPEKPAVEAALDNTPEIQQPEPEQEEPNGELVLSRSVAKRMGWVPKDEWKRDPAKWTDAPEFLERTPTELETTKERLRRMGQVSEAAAEEARRAGIKEAEERLRAAARAGDETEAVNAARDRAKYDGPPPQTVAWLGRNPWFHSDPDAQALAASAMRRAEAQGLSIEEQLADGEAAVRKRFPEHFGRTETKTEVRLSEVRKDPPAVAGGSRSAGGGKPKDKGWGDIPSFERGEMQKHFVRKFVRTGMSETDAQAKLAATYWAEKA